MKYKIALIGFGVVGQGFARILLRRKAMLKRAYGVDVEVVAISDIRLGSVYVDGGINLDLALKLLRREGSIKNYPKGRKGLSSLETIKETDANVIVEVTPTNLETGEPGRKHIKTALSEGKHVITTNKGPIALAYKELKEIAERKGVLLRFEGTVMSGTPVIATASELLAGDEIKEIYGIVNGTTNFILTKMEEGMSYEDALRMAQRMGYAEADPSMDVDGWDAAAKASILANAVMNGDVNIKEIEREGIRGISQEIIKSAMRKGRRIKLIIRVWREGKVRARVKVEEVGKESPLFTVSGVTNALVFKTDNLGEITLIGPGAGGVQTGQAILSDLLAINRLLQAI
ncbi:homoserine dehydrogenase [Candidatus Geothermarchaeota archaeon]|nr:MAG: homoserine dehydrogenase [Candidatus Geothermarchaeota archaeon]